MLFSSKLYESVDGGNWFVEKEIENPPQAFEIKDILFQSTDDLYVVLVLDTTSKR